MPAGQDLFDDFTALRDERTKLDGELLTWARSLPPEWLAAHAAPWPHASERLAMLIEPLSARERQVLGKMADGLGNRQIAQVLEISEHTAKFHVAQILGKLQARSRTEAVVKGLRHGLVGAAVGP